MSENIAAIIGTGMITAAGTDAKQTAASVRAGISRFVETSVYDKSFDPFVMAVLPDDVLPPLSTEMEKAVGLNAKQARMLRLASPAISEATKNLHDMDNVPLYLGIPQHAPERPALLNNDFFHYLSNQSGARFNTLESRLYPHGRAAGLFALGNAMKAIVDGMHQYAIVGGLDTYMDLFLLGTLDLEDRILGPHVMDGFIPGEGAAFVLIAGMKKVKSEGLKPLALLTPVAMDLEKGHLYSEEPYSGEGLSNAFRELFQSSGLNSPVKEVFTSMNGENHWAKEWGIAHMRNREGFAPGHGLHHPADCFGDTGAASAIIMINSAAIGMERGYYNSPALVFCSSDYGERAAVCVLLP